MERSLSERLLSKLVRAPSFKADPSKCVVVGMAPRTRGRRWGRTAALGGHPPIGVPGEVQLPVECTTRVPGRTASGSQRRQSASVRAAARAPSPRARLGEAAPRLAASAPPYAHPCDREAVYPADAAAYQILDDCGRGVSATVHRAACRALNDEVAVKKLNLESLTANLVRRTTARRPRNPNPARRGAAPGRRPRPGGPSRGPVLCVCCSWRTAQAPVPPPPTPSPACPGGHHPRGPDHEVLQPPQCAAPVC